VLGFLSFAGVLIATGAGQFFLNLANAGFGKSPRWPCESGLNRGQRLFRVAVGVDFLANNKHGPSRAAGSIN